METPIKLRPPYRLRAWSGWGAAIKEAPWLKAVLNLKVASIVGLVAVWWVVSLFMSAEILPGPQRTAETLWAMAASDPFGKNVYFHVGVTYARIAGTFAAAMVLGIAIGLLMGLHRHVESALINLIPFWLALPTLMVVFLSILWLGFSETGGLLAVIAVVTPFVIMNVWEGAKAMDKELIDMGRAFQANQRMMVQRVFLPQLLPYIFSAFRYGFGVTWKVVLLAEAFGLKYGMGFMITHYYNSFSMERVFGWVILFVVLMLLLEHLVFARVEDRAFRWRHQVAV